MNCTLYDSGVAGIVMVVRCATHPDPWWRTMLSFATPLLVLFSVFIAWRSLVNNRSVARKKATLDLIEKVESTEHYRAAARAFDAVRKSANFHALNDPQSDGDRMFRRQVLDYIGHYELVGIGIRRGVLDETIYRSWMQSHVVMEWNAAADFVQRERWRVNAAGTSMEYRAQFFENFQWMACRWSADARKVDAASSPEPGLPIGDPGPGDVAMPAVDDVDSDARPTSGPDR